MELGIFSPVLCRKGKKKTGAQKRTWALSLGLLLIPGLGLMLQIVGTDPITHHPTRTRITCTLLLVDPHRIRIGRDLPPHPSVSLTHGPHRLFTAAGPTCHFHANTLLTCVARTTGFLPPPPLRRRPLSPPPSQHTTARRIFQPCDLRRGGGEAHSSSAEGTRPRTLTLVPSIVREVRASPASSCPER
jgi:hypothetical protein